MRMRILIVAVLAMLFILAGCIKEMWTDPNTGELSTTYRLDPNTADQGEAIASGVVAVGGGLTAFLPWLAPFVTAGAGGLAAWRKMRPKLEQATKERDLSFKAGTTLAQALRQVKEKHPRIWDDVKPIIEDAAKPASEIENVIRGFRGLPSRAPSTVS